MRIYVREDVQKRIKPVSFSKLVLEFALYLDGKRIEEAIYAPLDYRGFYVESGVKKKYSLSKEVEEKFKNSKRLHQSHLE